MLVIPGTTTPEIETMKTLNDWRQERGRHVTEMRALTEKAKAENRSLTDEENATWDRLDKAQEDLATRIRREERQVELDREMAAKHGTVVTDTEGRELTVAEEEQRYTAAMNEWCRGGVEALSPEQRSLMSKRRAPNGELRAQSTTTTAGGYTIPQSFSGELEKALKSYSGMVQASRILPTDSGAALPWPTLNDTAQLGEQLAENGTAASQDMTFGVLTLNAYKYSSKIILVSMELLQDSAFSMDTVIAPVAGERIGRILNQRFTTGTGSSQPNGVVTAATLGTTFPTGNTTAVPYTGIIDLEHSVDPAYRQSGKCAYMLHDTTLKAVKKILDSQNRPLWQAGLKEGAGDTFNGYPYFINQDLAVPAANAKTILFGDFSKYLIRQVRGIFLFRFAEKYMDAGQIGFLALARYDGNLLDAGTHPICYAAQSAT